MMEIPFWLLVAQLVWAAPLVIVLQLTALAYLLWQAYRGRAYGVGQRRVARWLIYVGVYVAPLYMLILSTALRGGYQGERGGHWFFHSHSEWAGMALVPVFAWATFRGAFLFGSPAHARSYLNYVVMITLVVICSWYAFATAFLGMSDDYSNDLSILACVPALAAINYALMVCDIRRRGMLHPESPRATYTWFAALGVSVLVRFAFAKRFYDALPKESPAGYGDCFVVTAAAHGHPALVGSARERGSGRVVNEQLRRMWAFESLLCEKCPRFHRRLRHVYDIVGPQVARRVRTPYAADAVYLLLKPVEWLAACITAIGRSSTR